MISRFQDGVVTFDASAKLEILSCFGKTIDAGEFLVESEDTTQKVVAQDGEYIRLKEFGGIKKGSEIYIKSNLPSLIELLDSLE
jgi:hypothetical protein